MSETNTAWLEKLGYERDARLVVVHVDDIGMCHGANVGAFEALDAGPASCGSLMVPCPWFAEAAAMAAERPGVDLGVHLTFTSEWEQYRWGPVAGRSAVPSLCAPDGAMYRSVAEFMANARVEEVEIEGRAQIEKALAAGIDVTHIDSHMGTAFLPPFIDVYSKLMREYRLPAFVAEPAIDRLPGEELPAVAEQLLGAVAAVRAAGFPIFDGFEADSLSFADGEGEAHNRRRIASLGPGLNYLIIHAARRGEELDAIAESKPHCRDFERRFYGSEAGREALRAEGLETIGMRPLRDALRAAGDA